MWQKISPAPFARFGSFEKFPNHFFLGWKSSHFWEVLFGCMKNGDIYNLLSFFCKYVDIVYIFFICIWIVIFVRSAGVSNFCCFLILVAPWWHFSSCCLGVFLPEKQKNRTAKRNMVDGFPPPRNVIPTSSSPTTNPQNRWHTQRTLFEWQPATTGGLWWWASTLHAIDASWGSPKRSFRNLGKRRAPFRKRKRWGDSPHENP